MQKQPSESHNNKAVQALAQHFGFTEENETILLRALTHPTFFEGRAQAHKQDNQRLEFLGDAVLDLLVGEALFRLFPDAQEGDLSKMRAYIVCEASFAEAAIHWHIDEALRLGRGAESGGDRHRASVLADAFEAVMGAVYLTFGLDAVRDVVQKEFGSLMEHLTREEYEDKKSLLQELVQATNAHGVNYKLLESSGPVHAPRFKSGAYCGKRLLGTGEGGSKKESETAAAAAALKDRASWLDSI